MKILIEDEIKKKLAEGSLSLTDALRSRVIDKELEESTDPAEVLKEMRDILDSLKEIIKNGQTVTVDIPKIKLAIPENEELLKRLDKLIDQMERAHKIKPVHGWTFIVQRSRFSGLIDTIEVEPK